MTNATELLKTRIKPLNSTRAPTDATCVLYIMSRDQRVSYNPALRAAQLHASALKLPLVVGFALYPSSNHRAKEHVAFMIEGLGGVIKALSKKNIPFVYRRATTLQAVTELADEHNPAAVYFDFSPLRSSLQAQKKYAEESKQPVYSVDAHNVIPLWVVSDKQEYAARTIRPKIHKHLSAYLGEDVAIESQDPVDIKSNDYETLREDLPSLRYEPSGIEHAFSSGENAAQKALQDFLESRLRGYSTQRNDPTIDGLSNLSPYLHFGQLAASDVVNRVQDALDADSSLQSDADALIEEMVVRKELSDNYCYYNQQYDSLGGAPDWARKTLSKHADDPREHIYSLAEFEKAQTHDPAWNASQLEMTRTGKMHGYMRMYWAKKVLEWSESPEEAIRVLTHLNDFYSLDGGDPNGYTGIMWSVAGVHDRPWQERPVYGTIRSMVYGGLKRKFDIEQYIDKYTK